jgi:hypothetical protein
MAVVEGIKTEYKDKQNAFFIQAIIFFFLLSILDLLLMYRLKLNLSYPIFPLTGIIFLMFQATLFSWKRKRIYNIISLIFFMLAFYNWLFVTLGKIDRIVMNFCYIYFAIALILFLIAEKKRGKLKNYSKELKKIKDKKDV